jgi:hypothetical protein
MAGGPTILVFGTDFEGVTKKDVDRLNMGIDNYFDFGGSGGASMWMEGLDRRTPNVNCHSGSRCVGMELVDIKQSRRNEFNIYGLQRDELFVSEWLLLPSGWKLHTSNAWYLLAAPFGTEGLPYLPYAAIHIGQSDPNVEDFFLTLEIKDINGVNHNYGVIWHYPLPRGRWFNLQYHVYRHLTNGFVKVWIDGQLLFDAENVTTKHPTIPEWYMSVARIYYDTSDIFSPYRILVDDLKIYNTEPQAVTTTPTSSSTTTTSTGEVPTVTSVSLNARLDASSSPPTVLISGSIYPTPGGPVNVTLEFSNNQGETYQEMTRVTSAPDGTFSFSWKAPGNDVFMIRADAQGVKSSAVSVGMSGVPGFPLESLLLGCALGLLFAIMRRRQRLSTRILPDHCLMVPS